MRKKELRAENQRLRRQVEVLTADRVVVHLDDVSIVLSQGGQCVSVQFQVPDLVQTGAQFEAGRCSFDYCTPDHPSLTGRSWRDSMGE